MTRRRDEEWASDREVAAMVGLSLLFLLGVVVLVVYLLWTWAS